MQPLPPAALGSCWRGADLLLSLEWELGAGRADQAGNVWPRQLCKHRRGSSALPALPEGGGRAAPAAERGSAACGGGVPGVPIGLGAGIQAREMGTCDPASHPASRTANPRGQRAHACGCVWVVCGTLGRRLLNVCLLGGTRGASVPAEPPLASVSLTNGVWFGGRALMKAVPAAGAGRGAPAWRTR